MSLLSHDQKNAAWQSSHLQLQMAPEYLEYVRGRIRHAEIDLCGRDVLDIGCGPGAYILCAWERSPRSITGLDVSSLYLKDIRAHMPQTHGVLASAMQLPFADASFDVVFLNEILFHVNAVSALGEVRRVLRPGGILWVSHHLAGYYWGKIFFRKGRPFKTYVIEGLSSVKRLLEPIYGSSRTTYTHPAKLARWLQPLQVQRQWVHRKDGLPCVVEMVAVKPK
jgi:ubiquinone/menaquinone biosynthesis C-methylase UbiE